MPLPVVQGACFESCRAIPLFSLSSQCHEVARQMMVFLGSPGPEEARELVESLLILQLSLATPTYTLKRGILPALARIRHSKGKVLLLLSGTFSISKASCVFKSGTQQRSQTFLADLRCNCPYPLNEGRYRWTYFLGSGSYAGSVFIYSTLSALHTP